VSAGRHPSRVVKFGGTSLGTVFRLRRAARRVEALQRAGERVVAVVSARGDTTDRLVALLGGVSRGGGAPHGRESDRALATGEDLAAALLAAALTSRGVPARSLRGGEAGVAVEGDHGAGEIHRVDAAALRALVADGLVPVVSGFQGARWDGETVTLARGGSDTSAVALAAALAVPCDIVTDVEGVHDRDPNRHRGTRLLPRLTHEELLALAASGAKVVSTEAARLAAERRVPLRVYRWDEPIRGPRFGTSVSSVPLPRLLAEAV
jgi:aspartate kinase